MALAFEGFTCAAFIGSWHHKIRASGGSEELDDIGALILLIIQKAIQLIEKFVASDFAHLLRT
nr:MAG TPA: hypothetical protein [Caudoviricetes sp.]